jgi:GNAT superfamily N-acetyltransferase
MTIPVTLTDGAVVELHPMQPEDAVQLVKFHGTLSPDTTYLRYFSFHPQLSEKELHRFTHVDHTDREALVAVVGDEIVGVARFDRQGDDEAEVAFVIADAWQGRGLGPLLLQHLAERARAVGVKTFVADTLPRNRPMLSVFRHAGLPYEEHFVAGTIRVELTL